MIDLGQHADFIIWSYIGVTLAIAGLVAWAVISGRRVEARIAALEAKGVRRRAEKAS